MKTFETTLTVERCLPPRSRWQARARTPRARSRYSLTAQEAARLERGQARDDQKQYRDGADGRLTVDQARKLNQAEDTQSKRIEEHRQNDIARN